MNNQTTDTMPEPVEPMAFEAPSISLSRRKFLVASSVTGLALVAAACGGGDDGGDATGDTGQTGAGEGGDEAASGDAAVAQFAAGLEVLAVGTYKAALDAATANKLGPVPPAVAEYVKTAMAHHQEHLDAWNKVLKSAGAAEVTTPDAKLKPVVDAEFAKVKDVAGAAKLALTLEEIAAQTYLKAIPSLQSKDAIKLAGSIQAVDQQHVAILNFALGMYPVPDVFQKTDKAASPA
ncbi:MAG: ferritin-like domain-containing protein [Actinobacteria bacterium]|nr:ferritin-like domain-containing protein [Actinomycetota bacterium]